MQAEHPVSRFSVGLSFVAGMAPLAFGAFDLGAGLFGTAENTGGATFGKAISNDYRATFFAEYPELEGKVTVHHAVLTCPHFLYQPL